MPARILALLLLVMLAPAGRGAWAQSRSIFDVPGGRVQRAVVTVGEEPPPEPLPESPMERLIAGVLAELKGRELNDLRATAPPNPRTADASSAQRWCVVHLYGPRERRRVAILRGRETFIAMELDPEPDQPPRRVELRRDAFASLYYSWPMYRGGFDSAVATDALGTVFPLDEGLTPGRFTLDRETVGQRILAGGRPSSDPVVRDLSMEKLRVRLPRGYNPRTPAGILVWVDAMPAGIPPSRLDRILDDMNLIVVSASGAGNERHMYARIQLALDGVATISHRYHADPARVYISGISGGGRIATIAQVCFPDVFMGCVPIVGMSCYQNVPNGLGQYYRAAFRRPGTAIFHTTRQRRIAPMSGRKDANLVEMQNAAEIMSRDGIPTRFFEDPQMGHEMPKEADLREALAWVDEPAAKTRADQVKAAGHGLDEYLKKGDRPPETSAERAQLLRVIQGAPWSEAAWMALELLRRG